MQTAPAQDHRPAYIRIAETLRARIVSGYYGEKIDGELPLTREWQVSRRTIQQALDVLVRESLLVRHHGAGTFINRQGVEKRYRAITSLTEGIAGQGLKPEFTVLESGPVLAGAAERAFFDLDPGEAVYRHKRLVAAQGSVLAVVTTSLNLRLLGGLDLSQLDGSLYQALRDQFGRTVVTAEDQYKPALADAETAHLLAIEPASAIFEAIRRARDQTGAAIELSRVSMQPVSLDISIRHTGFPVEAPPEEREWSYAVGFGSFRG